MTCTSVNHTVTASVSANLPRCVIEESIQDCSTHHPLQLADKSSQGFQALFALLSTHTDWAVGVCRSLHWCWLHHMSWFHRLLMGCSRACQPNRRALLLCAVIHRGLVRLPIIASALKEGGKALGAWCTPTPCKLGHTTRPVSARGPIRESFHQMHPEGSRPQPSSFCTFRIVDSWHEAT